MHIALPKTHTHTHEKRARLSPDLSQHGSAEAVQDGGRTNSPHLSLKDRQYCSEMQFAIQSADCTCKFREIVRFDVPH